MTKGRSSGRAAVSNKTAEKMVQEEVGAKVKSPAHTKTAWKTPKQTQDGGVVKAKSPARVKTANKTPKQMTGGTTGKTSEDINDKVTNRKIGPKSTKQAKTSGEQRDNTISQNVDQKTLKAVKAIVTDKPTSRKKKGVQHVDDVNFELDRQTGKFVKKKKVIVEEEEPDNDNDEDFKPGNDIDEEDEDDGENDDDEDDDNDFDIPKLRPKKPVVSDKSTSQKKRMTSKDTLDELADFVDLEVPTRKFQKFMREEAEELEQAVRQGTNVKATYEQFVENVIVLCRRMEYEIPADINMKSIIGAIEDPKCRAWFLKMQGVKTAGQGDLPTSKSDNAGVCIAKKKYEIADLAKYMEEVSKDWSEVKQAHIKESIKKVMGNISITHRMVSEAGH